MHRSFDKVSKMIKSKALEFSFQLDWNLLQFIRVFRPQWRLRRRAMRPGVRCLLCVQVKSYCLDGVRYYLHSRVTGCSATISQNSTHIQNPGFPAAYTDTTSCEYTLGKVSTDICQFRLDFVNFVITGPDVNTSPYTECSDDKMIITTPSASAPPTICGYNTGHHIYIDSSRGSLTSNPIIAMTFTGVY